VARRRPARLRIFAARGGRPTFVKDVLVFEAMRLMEGRDQEAVGV